MSGSIQGRRSHREIVQYRPVRRRRTDGLRNIPAAARHNNSALRLIGLPLTITVPKLSDVPLRYCSRWEERPAAQLGKSLLRLGICEPSDWSGSAVDLVERGFKRFCLANGAEVAAKVWQGELRIMDHEFDLTESERQQVIAEMDEPTQLLYLVGDYSAAASIPIGPAWAVLEREEESLPAAFYRVFVDNLWTWMRVYDFQAALDHAEMWLEDLEGEELQESLYLKTRQKATEYLKACSGLTLARACRILEAVHAKLRSSPVRELVSTVLEMNATGQSYEHAWPGRLVEQVPSLEEFLSEADGCGPGSVITWHEDDEISACFDEDMSALGQNGPMEPSTLLLIQLDQPDKDLDLQVKSVFEYDGAMLRSLAAAARIVEIIREFYDEHLRKHRLQPGLQA